MTTSRSSKAALSQTISSLLDDLGPDRDTIAATLRDSGVQGYRGISTDCVVARYLNAVIGADPQVGSIAVRVNSVRVSGRHRWSSGLKVKLPQAVRQFMCAFDRGRYPDLVCRTSGDRILARRLSTKEGGPQYDPTAV